MSFWELLLHTKRWPMAPFQLRLPPLAQTSSYATASEVSNQLASFEVTNN